MRKVFGIAAATAAIAMATTGFVAPANAQPYGYGMMGGYGPGYMMGPGYGPGYMMGPAYGPGWMMRGGYGPGWMMGYGGGYGPGWMMQGGPGYRADLHLSTDQVKNYLEQTIRNPNLKVGDIKEKDADTIVADIVTKDKDALVQKLDINRHTGYMQPEQ